MTKKNISLFFKSNGSEDIKKNHYSISIKCLKTVNGTSRNFEKQMKVSGYKRDIEDLKHKDFLRKDQEY